jgi:hypothetical protein
MNGRRTRRYEFGAFSELPRSSRSDANKTTGTRFDGTPMVPKRNERYAFLEVEIMLSNRRC